jgi:hypothetical protein
MTTNCHFEQLPPRRILYNVQSMNKIWRNIPVVLLLAVLLAGCNYPEQGYYELVALDEYGNELLAWPFAIEELVDDSEMTYGFMLVLPSGEGLWEYRLEDVASMHYRGWTVELPDSITGFGDVDLGLYHANETMTIIGAYRESELQLAAAAQKRKPLIWLFRAEAEPDFDTMSAKLHFSSTLPPVSGAAEAAQYMLRSVDKARFAAALSVPLEEAERRAGIVREPLPVEDAVNAHQVDTSPPGIDDEAAIVQEAEPDDRGDGPRPVRPLGG